MSATQSPPAGRSAARRRDALRRIQVLLKSAKTAEIGDTVEATGQLLLDVDELARAFCRLTKEHTRFRKVTVDLARANEKLLNGEECTCKKHNCQQALEELQNEHGSLKVLFQEEKELSRTQTAALRAKLAVLNVSIEKSSSQTQTDPVLFLDGEEEDDTTSHVVINQSRDEYIGKLREASKAVTEMRNEKQQVESKCRTLEYKVEKLEEERDMFKSSAENHEKSAEKGEKHFLKMLDAANMEIKALMLNIDMLQKSLDSAQGNVSKQRQDMEDQDVTIKNLKRDKKKQFEEIQEQQARRESAEFECVHLRDRVRGALKLAALAAGQLDDVALERTQLRDQVTLLETQLQRRDNRMRLQDHGGGHFLELVQMRRNVYLLQYENGVLKARLARMLEKVQKAGRTSTAAVVSREQPDAIAALQERLSKLPTRRAGLRAAAAAATTTANDTAQTRGAVFQSQRQALTHSDVHHRCKQRKGKATGRTARH